MRKKTFKYPQGVQITRLICKIWIGLAIFVLLPLLIKSSATKEIGTVFDHIFAITLPPLMLVAICAFYLGEWPNFEVDDEGVLVEFLWRKLRVTWDSITKIENVDFYSKNIVVVLVDDHHLTEFHRIYGLFMFISFQRGFHIYPYTLEMQELLQVIQKRAKLKKSRGQHTV